MEAADARQLWLEAIVLWLQSLSQRQRCFKKHDGHTAAASQQQQAAGKEDTETYYTTTPPTSSAADTQRR